MYFVKMEKKKVHITQYVIRTQYLIFGEIYNIYFPELMQICIRDKLTAQAASLLHTITCL